MDNLQEMDKNWKISNSTFSSTFKNNTFIGQSKKCHASMSGNFESNSSGSSGYVDNQAMYHCSTKSGASESSSSGSSGYGQGKKSDFKFGRCSKFGHFEINYYENSGYVTEPTAFSDRFPRTITSGWGKLIGGTGFTNVTVYNSSHAPKEMGNLEELDKTWKNSDSAFSSSGSNSQSRQSVSQHKQTQTVLNRLSEYHWWSLEAFQEVHKAIVLNKSCDVISQVNDAKRAVAHVRRKYALHDYVGGGQRNGERSAHCEYETNQQPKKQSDKNIKKKIEGKERRQNISNISTSISNEFVQPKLVTNAAEIITPQIKAPPTRQEPINFAETVTPPLFNAQRQTVSENTVKCKNTATLKTASSKVPEQPTKKVAPPTVVRQDPSAEGFRCIVSVHDGIVIHNLVPMTSALGFPNDLWIGRSFIDFVHPKDRCIFALHLTTGLTPSKRTDNLLYNQVSTIVCRLRISKNMASGFVITEQPSKYIPFLLKFYFRNINAKDNQDIYFVIQGTPQPSAYKTPNEKLRHAIPFTMRHSADGTFEFVDTSVAPYLGYMPHEMINKDALQLFHPDDLRYIREVYEAIIQTGGMTRSEPYRMLAQNGHYVKLETEWHSFVNMWSRKLEFVVGKNFLLQGPKNPDVFAPSETGEKFKNKKDTPKQEAMRETIRTMMVEVLAKPAKPRQDMNKICENIKIYLQKLAKEVSKTNNKVKASNNHDDRGSVSLGGISPYHEYFDNKSSTDTPLSYTKLNYNETLDRYFVSHEPFVFKDTNTTIIDITDQANIKSLKRCHSPDALPSQKTLGGSSPDASNNQLPTEAAPEDCQTLRLTASLLSQHNVEMEKELVNKRRSSTKEKAKLDTEEDEKICSQKNNPSNTNAEAGPSTSAPQRRKLNRSMSEEYEKAAKQRCLVPPEMTVPDFRTTPIDESSFFGMTPLFYYTPINSEIATQSSYLPTCTTIYPGNAKPCVLYGQPIYPLPYLIKENFVAGLKREMIYKLPDSNYEECKFNPDDFQLKSSSTTRLIKENACAKLVVDRERGCMSSSSAESWPRQGPKDTTGEKDDKLANTHNSKNTIPAVKGEPEHVTKTTKSDTTFFETDEDSSTSTFYASFLRTDSSAEESERKSVDVPVNPTNPVIAKQQVFIKHDNVITESMIKKKKDPLLLKVNATDELLMKYRIKTDSLAKVLAADKKRLFKYKQSRLPKVQMEQIHFDFKSHVRTPKSTAKANICSSSSAKTKANIIIKENVQCLPEKTVSLMYGENKQLQELKAHKEFKHHTTLPLRDTKSEFLPADHVMPLQPFSDYKSGNWPANPVLLPHNFSNSNFEVVPEDHVYLQQLFSNYNSTDPVNQPQPNTNYEYVLPANPVFPFRPLDKSNGVPAKHVIPLQPFNNYNSGGWSADPEFSPQPFGNSNSDVLPQDSVISMQLFSNFESDRLLAEPVIPHLNSNYKCDVVPAVPVIPPQPLSNYRFDVLPSGSVIPPLSINYYKVLPADNVSPQFLSNSKSEILPADPEIPSQPLSNSKSDVNPQIQ